MTNTLNPLSIRFALQAVRRGIPAPPAPLRDAISMELLFFSGLMIVLLATQVMGLWGGYRFLDSFAHPMFDQFPVGEIPVSVAK